MTDQAWWCVAQEDGLALLETLLGDAADELEEHASSDYPHRDQYPSEMQRYRCALETPNRIRAALANRRTGAVKAVLAARLQPGAGQAIAADRGHRTPSHPGMTAGECGE